MSDAGDRNRTTDPAPPPSREAMFDDLMEKVASLHQAQIEIVGLLERVVVKHGNLSEAVLDIQASLAALWGDGTLVREQLQPMGVRIGELGSRLDRLEKRIRDSQIPEAP